MASDETTTQNDCAGQNYKLARERGKIEERIRMVKKRVIKMRESNMNFSLSDSTNLKLVIGYAEELMNYIEKCAENETTNASDTGQMQELAIMVSHIELAMDYLLEKLTRRQVDAMTQAPRIQPNQRWWQHFIIWWPTVLGIL